ncbi:MAG: RagB/SusD family nutrient uptake outer membrane protein, partial [Dysgonamonadaceae bacterium]|nr:RagB/SusD family nutrient uptake outer membrane protein [Dysgonamonadaceae bacterium]
PKNVYYKNDGEKVIIYGLNHGDTDEAGAALGYPSSKTWKLSASDDKVTYWDALFVRDPDIQQFWPIWQIFLDTGNGSLNNDGYNTPTN